MTEPEWLACEEPQRILVHLGPDASERKMLLFCVACCRHSGHDGDERRTPIVAVEKYADDAVIAEQVQAALNYVSDGCPVLETARYIVLRAEGYDIDRLELVGYIANLAAWHGGGAVGKSESQRVAELGLRKRVQGVLLRDIFGNPFRTVAFASEWRTSTAVALAAQMYEARDFSAMPILADALQDAGCDHDDVLAHCRQPGEHVRGCWVVDLVLGRE